MIRVTYEHVCDKCAAVRNVETGMYRAEFPIPLPDARLAMGMTLCEPCHLKAAGALAKAFAWPKLKAVDG